MRIPMYPLFSHAEAVRCIFHYGARNSKIENNTHHTPLSHQHQYAQCCRAILVTGCPRHAHYHQRITDVSTLRSHHISFSHQHQDTQCCGAILVTGCPRYVRDHQRMSTNLRPQWNIVLPDRAQFRWESRASCVPPPSTSQRQGRSFFHHTANTG